MKRLYTALIILLVSISCLASNADSEYATTASKARRFFDNAEWPSACAMYILMLEQRPEVTSTYADAIVANIMAGDTVSALDLVPRSMNNSVSLDTLLTDVRSRSFSIGNGKLYEHFLVETKDHYPWLGRIVDNYLMKYYDFRQNGPMLIFYARKMLEGLPDDVDFMRMLARGLLLNGQTSEAVSTWTHILELHPDNYDTLLDLGNYYDTAGLYDKALELLSRADRIHPTPYVTGRINEIQKTKYKHH